MSRKHYLYLAVCAASLPVIIWVINFLVDTLHWITGTNKVKAITFPSAGVEG